MLWTLIRQQAAREGPPHFLLSEAPKQQTISSAVHTVRYLLRLSQIRTLYWISDELERYLSPLHAPASRFSFCWGSGLYHWATSVHDPAMREERQ